jgi:hypothetical protein
MSRLLFGLKRAMFNKLIFSKIQKIIDFFSKKSRKRIANSGKSSIFAHLFRGEKAAKRSKSFFHIMPV